MPRRVLLVSAVGALLAVAALLLLRGGELPSAQPPSLPPDLARFLPLEVGAEPHYLDFDWLAGESRSIVVAREVTGWVELDGEPHARVDFRRGYSRHHQLYLTEWLRVTDDEVLCPLRELAGHRYRIEPPQPILRLPLEQGQTWTWRGTVDGVPADASFEVIARRPDETHGEVLEIRSTTTLGNQTGTQVTTYAADQGPIAATGIMPRGDLTISDTSFEVELFPPPDE